MIQFYSTTTYNGAYLIFPPIDIDDISRLRVKFDAATGVATCKDGREIRIPKKVYEGKNIPADVILGIRPEDIYEDGNIDFTVCANAIWLDNESLLVTIRPIQTGAKRNLIFEFRPKDKVVMIPSSSPSGAEILNNLGGFFEQMIPNNTIDCRADIYSLGIILRNKFPKSYQKIADKCAQQDRDMRYSSIDEIKKHIKKKKVSNITILISIILILLFTISFFKSLQLKHFRGAYIASQVLYIYLYPSIAAAL